MAAIYSGIQLKLRSTRTPWEDKLKLARFAWISPYCVIPNKEQVLFDWMSHALTVHYSKKADLPQAVVEGLWTYLDDILHSRKLQNVLKQGKTVTLRLAMAQVIKDRLHECATGACTVSVSTVLGCCQGILSSPVLSATFCTKYELLVELLAKLSSLACSRLGSEKSGEPVTAQVFEVHLLAISSYLVVQRQQANPSRVFSQVSAHLLQPLLLLRHLLATRMWTAGDDTQVRQHLSREVRSKVDALLQASLFSPEHLGSYKEELLGDESSGAKKGSSGKSLLCPVSSVLRRLCDPGFCEPWHAHFAVLSNSLPLLFKLSLDGVCKGDGNKMVCFRLLQRFVTALGFTDLLVVKETFNSDNWNLALLALENLLNYSLAADIYNVAADRIHHDEVQFKFYRMVAQMLFQNVNPSIPAWYRCLKALLALNHMIIEPDLDDLISAGWIDIDSVDHRVTKARETLLSSVFQTYTKLRQLPKFLDEVVEVICRPAADELRPPILTAGLQKSLEQCLLDIPQSQSLEICRLLLDRAQCYLIPDLQGQEDMGMKLFSLSVLVHCVLFSMKSLDNSSPLPVIKQAVTVMGEIVKVIQLLLKHLRCQESDSLWFQKVLESALLLTYVTMEVDTLFQIHCSKYLSTSTVNNNPVDEEVSTFTCVATKEWTQVNDGSWACSPISQFLKEMLALHKLKQVLRANFTSDSEVRDVLSRHARFIIHSGSQSFSQPSCDTWNRQICSVDAQTYPTAHWFFITSNLPLIVPQLAEKDLSYIAKYLLDSLLQEDVSVAADCGTSLSVSMISQQLLNGMFLVELPSLYSCVTRGLLHRIVEILRLSTGASQCKAIMKFVDGEFFNAGEKMEITDADPSTEDISPFWKRLESIAQETLCSVRDGDTVILSRTQVCTLRHVLRAASALRPDGLSREDFSEYYLLLFFIATSVQCEKDTEVSQAIGLLKEVYSLMTSLESGKNMGAVMKVAHGSDVLEAHVISLLSSKKKNLFRAMGSCDWLAVLQTVQNYLQCLIQTVIHRRKSAQVNLEKFTSFMVECIGPPGAVLDTTHCKHNTGEVIHVQVLLSIFGTLCQAATSSLLMQKHMAKAMEGILIGILRKGITTVRQVIQATQKSKTFSLLGQTFTMRLLTVMTQVELTHLSYSISPMKSGTKSVALEFSDLKRRFAQNAMAEIGSTSRPMDFLVPYLKFLTLFFSANETVKELDETFVSVVQNLRRLLSAPWLSTCDLRGLETPVKEMLAQLVVGSSTQQFHHLLADVTENLGTSHHTDVIWAVTITKLLTSCSLPEAHSQAFWFMVPQIITGIICTVKEFGREKSLTATVTVPAVDCLTALLRHGEGWLLNPHHVTVVFGALHFVPLEHLTPEVYYSAFHAIHEALFAIIQCYPKVMLKAAPSFLNSFYRLVVSIMHEGRQKGETERGSEDERDTLLKCARLVERMYTHIASAAEGFTALSSFIVAQFVSELQKVTLIPDIKRHLTEGVYQILDLCLEQDGKFLNACLQTGVREVFAELYASYTHYHKRQRQGDEKYTV